MPKYIGINLRTLTRLFSWRVDGGQTLHSNPHRFRGATSGMVANIVMVGSVLLVNLLLFPLYYRFIPHEILGVWLVAVEVATLIQALDFGVSNVAIMLIAKSLEKGDEITAISYMFGARKALSKIALLVLILCLLGCLIGFFLVELTLDVAVAFSLLSASVSVTILTYSQVGYLRARMTYIPIVYSHVVSNGVFLLVGASLLFLKTGVIGIAAAFFIRSAVYWYLLERSVMRGQVKLLRTQVQSKLIEAKQSTLSFISSALYTLSLPIESVAVMVLMGPVAVAQYIANRKIFDLVKSVMDGLTSALYPILSTIQGSRARMLYLCFYILLGLLGASVGFLIVKVGLNSWLGRDIYISDHFSLVLGMQMVCVSTLYYLRVNYKSLSNFKVAAGSSVIEVISKLLLIAFLSVPLGLLAVPLGAIISSLIQIPWLLLKLYRFTNSVSKA